MNPILFNNLMGRHKYTKIEDTDDDSVALMMGQAPPRLSRFTRNQEYIELDTLDDSGDQSANERYKQINTKLKDSVRKSSKNLLIIILGAAFSIISVMVVFSVKNKPQSFPKELYEPVLTKTLDPATRLSNGTHEFRRSTLFISLDGVHPHYISKERTPYLHKLASEGFAPPYMLPSFPSQTFPNHYTLVTGMYPINHGIVGNTFYDPELDLDFVNTDKNKSRNRKFWGGEPLWTTARKNGMLSSVHMWPGSEAEWAPEEAADEVSVFNKSEELDLKVQKVTEWLDRGTNMPQVMMLYVPNIDTVGHKKGIFGNEILNELKLVDNMLSQINETIALRNLTDVINLVVVSDHGMAPTSDKRLVFLDDLIANYTDTVKSNRGWPLAGLRFESNVEQERALANLRWAQRRYPGFKVYKSNEMPSSWRFTTGKMRYQRRKREDDLESMIEQEEEHTDDNDNVEKPVASGRPEYGRFRNRLAPVYLVPDVGYNFLTHEQYDKMDHEYFLKGVHGYVASEPLMRALFLAQGPAFPPGKYYPIDNVDVYSAICRSVGMKPNPESDGDFRARRLLRPLPVPENYPGVGYHIDVFENTTFSHYFQEV